MTEFQGYFDDSNSHQDAPLILWAGFVGYQNQWGLLDEKWRAILKREGLSHMHMVKLQQRDPPFDRPDPNGAWRDSLIHDLREAIFKSGLFGIGAGIPYAHWDEVVTPEMEKWVSSPKVVSLILCYATSIQRAPKQGWSGRPVRLFFDQGIEKGGLEAIDWINHHANRFNGSSHAVGFLPVKDAPALQAADMFAWELQNDMKNYLKFGRDRAIRPHYAPWMRQQSDIQFMEADVLRERLAMPEFKELLDDKLWSSDGSPKAF